MRVFTILPILLGHVVAAGRSLHGRDADAVQNVRLLELFHDEIRDTNNVTIGEIRDMNRGVEAFLERMLDTPYFSTYKVDLSDARCPFKDEEGICGNQACAIQPLSEDDVRFSTPQYLGRLRKDSVSHKAPQANVERCAPEQESIYAHRDHRATRRSDSDSNYCYPEDEDDSSSVWVDLTDNVERYTGYSGDHAHMIWNRVYAENCFGYAGSDYNVTGTENSDMGYSSAELSGEAQLANIFANPMMKPSHPQDMPLNLPECVEQRLFYKLLSGMHASISTHLSFDYLDKTTGTWGPNLTEFLDRVGWHPDRINHLFFNYVLVSRAVAKLETYQRFLSFAPTCSILDWDVRQALQLLGGVLAKSRRGINETELFASPEGRALKEEFRRRVRNVNALMSCVGCERCRLWGKLQTAGYGTALKILFELPEHPEDDLGRVADVLNDFRRSELVALVQTFARLSHSVSAVSYFQWEAENRLIDKSAFKYQWAQAVREAKEGLSFIFRSYIDFPKNIAKLALLQLHSWWMRFISGGHSVPVTRIEL